MLNNEKIILMTKLALYEQGEGKKKIPIGKYFKSDFVGMRMLGSFVYITIAYIICMALWFLASSDKIIKEITKNGVTKTVIVLAIIYIAAVLIYMFICYIYFTYQFKNVRKSLKEYNSGLNKLHKIQEKEIESLLNESEIYDEAGGDE